MKNVPKRRVVVTGIGAVTTLGQTLEETWRGVLAGEVRADYIKQFDASEMPCQVAYEVDGFDYEPEFLSATERDYLTRAARMGVKAAAEALSQADLAPGKVDPFRAAVSMGGAISSPGYERIARMIVEKQTDAEAEATGYRFLPHMAGSILAKMLGAKGGTSTPCTACASSGQSLGEAYELIAYGDADVVLTGGADSMINSFAVAGFSLLGALAQRNDDPKTASRPFDKDRNGFVLGEGACVLVFEELEHATKRGATILAEVCGYGITESAYRITDLHPEGQGPIEAMQEAIADAGLTPSAIGYVNAHGTATHLNDQCEAVAINKVLPQDVSPVKVSSTKSLTGHTISAAGALEFMICVMAIRDQILPPSANLFHQDHHCPVRLTATRAEPTRLDYALSNSVGFGGSNIALIAGRFPC